MAASSTAINEKNNIAKELSSSVLSPNPGESHLDDFYEVLEFFLRKNNEDKKEDRENQIVDLATMMCNKSLSPQTKKEYFEKLVLICKNDDHISKNAYWLLGYCYEYGFGTKKNSKNALYYYRLALKHNCPYGITALGACFLEGKEVKKNKEIAFKLFNFAAKQNHAIAQCYLFSRFLIRLNTPSQAKDLLIRSANQGFSEAQCILGKLYLEGLNGFEKDPSKALTFIEKAAVRGHARANYELALLYEVGDIVPQDLPRAFSLLQEAAAQNNSKAQIQLAEIYSGDSKFDYKMKKDLTKAVEYYTKASEDDEDAYCELGWCFETGKGVEPDFNKAVELYRKGAALEEINCLFALANCYAEGNGVVKDRDQAIKYYELGLEQGNDAFTHYQIGKLLFQPIACNTDYKTHADNIRAVKHFKSASLFEDSSTTALAQSMLADCYYRKIGVYQDGERAILLKMNAIRMYANEDDQKTLGEYLAEIPEQPRNLADSIELYRAKAKNKDGYSIELMGFCYHYGLGVERNIQEAIVHYKSCIEDGHFYVLWDLLDLYNSLALNEIESDEDFEFDVDEALEYFKTLSKGIEQVPNSMRLDELEASRVLMVIYQEGLLGQEKNVWTSCQPLVAKLFKIGSTNDFQAITRDFEMRLYDHRPQTSDAQAEIEIGYLKSNMILHGFKKFIKGMDHFKGIDEVSSLITEYTLDLPADKGITLKPIPNSELMVRRPEFETPY